MGGIWKTVLKIALGAALVVLVAAGCGSSSRHVTSAERGIPRPLASAWAAQASTIAAAASAGDGCRARRLAGSLRTEVIEAGGRVPARLSVPLLESINSLADRFTCVVPPVTITTTPTPPPPPKPKHGHGHHDHHGPGPGDQGNES